VIVATGHDRVRRKQCITSERNALRRIFKLKGQFVTSACLTKAYAFRMKSAFARWYIAAILSAGAAWGAIYFPADARQQQRAVAAEITAVPKGPDLVDQLRRDSLPPQVGGLFATYALMPVQVLPSPALKLATQPPFPLRFGGYLKREDNAITFYFAHGTEILPLRAGDLVEGFRIEAFHDDAVEMTFVATGQHVSLPFSAVAASTAGAEDNATRTAQIPVAAAPARASGPVPVWSPSPAQGVRTTMNVPGAMPGAGAPSGSP
jgi:hypothetical protein